MVFDNGKQKGGITVIDTNIFDNNNAFDEDLIKCMSQTEDSDLILCRICQHYPACVGLSLKRTMEILSKLPKIKEEENIYEN